MSRRNQLILIGGLVGGVIGVLIGWAYAMLSEDDASLPAAAANRGLKLQADGGDLLRLGLAFIPVVSMVKKLFVPADEGGDLPTPQRKS